MNGDQKRRRLYSALVALAVAGLGVVVHTSPAAAAESFSFSGPTASGTVTFLNGYTVTVTGSVWGDVDGPGYFAEGEFFGVGRYVCDSVTRQNYNSARLQTYTDTLSCSYANIQQVEIVYLGSGVDAASYINNPYA